MEQSVGKQCERPNKSRGCYLEKENIVGEEISRLSYRHITPVLLRKKLKLREAMQLYK